MAVVQRELGALWEYASLLWSAEHGVWIAGWAIFFLSAQYGFAAVFSTIYATWLTDLAKERAGKGIKSSRWAMAWSFSTRFVSSLFSGSAGIYALWVLLTSDDKIILDVYAHDARAEALLRATVGAW
jgi:hypothetical protein